MKKDTKKSIALTGHPVVVTVPELGWKVIDTLQGWAYEYSDGSHDWPTPRERQLLTVIQHLQADVERAKCR